MRFSRFMTAFVLMLAISFSHTALANMAAPKEADIGSAITFEKNDEIAVLSETLDITVNGVTADIHAVYSMKNTSDESVATQVMFLSPNIQSGYVRVRSGGEEISLAAQSYALSYSTEIVGDDWRYAVLTDGPAALDGRTVDAVSFELAFAPSEQREVAVSYIYQLGGYPEYDFDVKMGRIEYLLAPAALWRGFENLTINLYLDEDMPVISSSSLEFERVGARHYRYVSDALPGENLQITIDENWFQNIISLLKSPYLGMSALAFLPILLVAAAIIAILIIVLLYKKKNRR